MERVGAEMEWSRLHHKNSQAFVSTLAYAHLGVDHTWMIQIHKFIKHVKKKMDFPDPVSFILLHNSALETIHLWNSLWKILDSKENCKIVSWANVQQLFLCQNCGRGVSRQDGLGGCGWKIRLGLTSIEQEFTPKCTVSTLWLSSLGGHAWRSDQRPADMYLI